LTKALNKDGKSMSMLSIATGYALKMESAIAYSIPRNLET